PCFGGRGAKRPRSSGSCRATRQPRLDGMRRARRSGTGIMLVALVVLLFASLMVALTIGPADIGVAEVLRAVLARLGFPEADESRLRMAIIADLRLPRLLAAA